MDIKKWDRVKCREDCRIVEDGDDGEGFKKNYRIKEGNYIWEREIGNEKIENWVDEGGKGDDSMEDYLEFRREKRMDYRNKCGFRGNLYNVDGIKI